jgi:hypothetical protein
MMSIWIHYFREREACRSLMLKTTTITQLANSIVNGQLICSSLVDMFIQVYIAPRMLRMLNSRARDA